MDPLFLSLPDSPDFRGWISANGFPRMDPAMLAAKTVNFELFSTFPFFASALILPRTDHFKLLVCISVRGSWSISFHFFPFQVTYCSSRWFAILGPFPAATIDFSHPFPTYLESVPPHSLHLRSEDIVRKNVLVPLLASAAGW